MFATSPLSPTQQITERAKTSAQLVKLHAYLMFSTSILPLSQKVHMHLSHTFRESNFAEVTSAFIKKYNEKNKWVTTTICHVEMIDDNQFQFVRRLENVMSSQPLYERIIVDREQMQLRGYTFEKKTDSSYSEHYIYSSLPDRSVNYEMFLFRDPGLKRFLRMKAFNWGVQNLQKLIEQHQKNLKARSEQAKILLRAKKDALQEKAKDKYELAKSKIIVAGEDASKKQ